MESDHQQQVGAGEIAHTQTEPTAGLPHMLTALAEFLRAALVRLDVGQVCVCL